VRAKVWWRASRVDRSRASRSNLAARFDRVARPARRRSSGANRPDDVTPTRDDGDDGARGDDARGDDARRDATRVNDAKGRNRRRRSRGENSFGRRRRRRRGRAT
jgi:hypothetical protein